MNKIYKGDNLTINILDAMMPGGIELSEKRGQEELVRSSQLPRELFSRDGESDARVWYEELGIEVDDANSDDELFYTVKMPTNITVNKTDHSMWSELLKDGIRIGSIFYKAACYDRRAQISKG